MAYVGSAINSVHFTDGRQSLTMCMSNKAIVCTRNITHVGQKNSAVGNKLCWLMRLHHTIQYSFISAQHICSVRVMSNIVVDVYINAGLGDSY